jgi:hypothetical protein
VEEKILGNRISDSKSLSDGVVVQPMMVQVVVEGFLSVDMTDEEEVVV